MRVYQFMGGRGSIVSVCVNERVNVEARFFRWLVPAIGTRDR